MSVLAVKTGVMNQCASSEQDIAKRISSISGEIDNIRQNLSFNIRARANINSQLITLKKVCQANASHVASLQSVLKDAVTAYTQAEKNACSLADGVAAAAASTGAAASAKSKQSDESIFKRILKDDWKIEGAVLAGSKTVSGSILGFDSTGTAEGDLVGGSIKTKSQAKWKLEKGEAGIEKSIEAEGHLAKGKLKGNIGLLGGEVSGTVGSVGATGKVGATLFKDGKFSPTLDAKLKAEAAAVKGSAEGKIGTDEHNAHIKGSGTLLGAEAEASGSVGKITYKDETTGQTKTEIGAKGKVGAEAYLAQGKVSGGFTIFGINIDAGIQGKAGGAGVTAEGKVTTGGVSGKIGAGLGLGAGLEISIDWSNFSLW